MIERVADLKTAPSASALGLPADQPSDLLTRVMVARHGMRNRVELMWEPECLPPPMDVQKVGSHKWQPFLLPEMGIEARDVFVPDDKRQDISIIQFRFSTPVIVPLHRHKQRTVLFCNNGEMELMVEGVQIELAESLIYDVEPGQLQMWVVNIPGTQITVTFIPGLALR